MNDAFDNLHRALAELWDAIKGPFIWILDRPYLILAYAILCAALMAFELFAR